MTLKITKKLHRFYKENEENCTICNRSFKSGDTTHLGYSEKKEYLYVGDCCAAKLKKTVVRYHFIERVYSKPDINATLWRFMSFEKFVSLLSTSSIFFCRIDQFRDPFEGAQGALENKQKWDNFYLNFFEEALTNLPEDVPKLQSDEVKLESKRLLDSLSFTNKKLLRKSFINCWYESEYESEAMWKLYSDYGNQAIAITTTYKNLKKQFGLDVLVGKVNYIDYNKKFPSISFPFFYKRKCFEHEKEVRAIIIDHENKEDTGKYIKVNLNELILDVYLSPSSPDWFKDAVEQTMKRFRLNKNLSRSRLDIVPF